jgi:hypothetical protein
MPVEQQFELGYLAASNRLHDLFVLHVPAFVMEY